MKIPIRKNCRFTAECKHKFEVPIIASSHLPDVI